MAYKFTGRIKKIGIENNSHFCEFYADNTIKINEREYGVAYCYDDKKNIEIVTIPTFQFEKTNQVLNMLQSFHDERFEIEYDKNSLAIKKVTVVK